MPWQVSSVMEKRKEFLQEYLSGEWRMSDLCRAYGISRPTGYAVVRRWEASGEAGLAEQSRRAGEHPNRTSTEVEEAVLEMRRKHPRWGARTLKKVLDTKCPQVRWPAASTIGEMLRREGLTYQRRRRRRTAPYTQPFQAIAGPNDSWCADFKGWFCTGDGERIDPLTISDAYSRYLLRCQAVAKTDSERTRAIFEAAFREYGMPGAIRTDNGVPFASVAVGGLSRLSVWWIKLGIIPERIAPGHPEQNGRHERMHRTLQEETAVPPAADRWGQQRAFDQFRQEYNEERPHQGLAMQTPSALYTRSPREYPERLPELEYGSALLVRRVHAKGYMHWKQYKVYLGEVLGGERIGLQAVDDRWYRVYLGWLPIARFDSRQVRIVELQQEAEREESSRGNVEIPTEGIPTFPRPDGY